MTELVTVRIKPGQSLTTPDGRLIGAGETVDLPAADAAFAVGMGAAEIVAPESADADQKPGKKLKA